jgi:serine O-acetyltransferase
MDTKTPITKHHKSSSFTSIFSTSDDDDHLDEKQKNETSASTSDNKDARSATDPYKTRLSSDEQLSLNSLDGANKRDKSTGMRQSGYDLGLGKNLPVGNDSNSEDHEKTKINKDVKTQLHWYAPDPVQKIDTPQQNFKPVSRSSYNGPPSDTSERGQRKRKMVARRQEDQFLRGALWHEEHYGDKDTVKTETPSDTPVSEMSKSDSEGPKKPALFYPDINLSIPSSIYSEENDVIWDLMRYEAYQEAQREPLLVSFLYSSILNHDSLVRS